VTGVLKTILWVYGIILIVVGIGCVVIPNWMAGTFYGVEALPNGGLFFAAMMGSLFIPLGVWLAIVSRDPIKNITWVKFIILKIGIWLVVEIYTLIKGYIEPNAMVITLLIVDLIFGMAFLIFYPRKIKSSLAKAS
jgi:hypothetical protein